MGRYGVQISQQGIPVDRATDYQKVLDSNWKFLDIAKEIDVDVRITINSTNGFHLFEVLNHGLGYVPAFEYFPSSLTVEAGGTNLLFNGYNESHKFLRADSNKVYVVLLYSGTPINIRIVGKLRVYALNVLEEYQAPTIPTITTSKQPVSRYGAKFLDLNNGTGDIEDEGMDPFTLNTRGKQMSVHKHGVATANAGLLTVTHNVSYPPSYMLCRVNEKMSWGVLYLEQLYPYPFKDPVVVGGMVVSYYLAEVNPTDIIFRGAQSTLVGKYGYIILKDPVEIAG